MEKALILIVVFSAIGLLGWKVIRFFKGNNQSQDCSSCSKECINRDLSNKIE